MKRNAITVLLALLAFPSAVPGAPQTPANKSSKRTLAATNIVHAAIGARITVSSTHEGEEGEGPASTLVDGNLITRWSSAYAQPQKIVLELLKESRLKTLRLHWEAAAATRYRVSVATDGKAWKKAHLYYSQTAGDPKPRIDEIDLKGVSADSIRLDLLRRINPEWGFSLYEVEVLTVGK